MKFILKRLQSKFVLIIVAIILFSIVFPSNITFAASEPMGGKLLKPVADLVLAFGDGILNVIHNVLFDMNMTTLRIKLKTTLVKWILTALVVVAVALVVAYVAAHVTAVAPALIAKLGTKLGMTVIATSGVSIAAVGKIVKFALGSGVVAGALFASGWFGNEVVLPVYKISPEEIFSGQIPIINVNFFADKSGDTIKNTSKSSIDVQTLSFDIHNTSTISQAIATALKEYGYENDNVDSGNSPFNGTVLSGISKKVSWVNKQDGHTYIANIEYDGDSIYTVKISKVVEGETQVQNIGEQLRGTVAKWYYILRNIALMLMVLVLIYLGIRIIISTVSNEKAKYKNMLNDWVVAMCLLFLMHYIMSFSMNLNDNFIKMAASATKANYTVVIEDTNGKIESQLKEENGENGITVDLTQVIDDSSSPKKIVWETGNLMGLYRVQAALNESGTFTYVGYVLAFLVLVWYTVFFLFSYIKRVIYLAFLTMIAPLVALTYPIDKVRDGKAQAFEMWFKEYIGNLVIQPVHLILYIVLISAAFELASENVLYTLVAIGFMLPAEKFIKKMFGLDRAQTPGTLGGAIGAGIAMNAVNKLLHLGHRTPKSQGELGGGSSKNKTDEEEAPTDPSKVDMLAAGGGTKEDPESYRDGKEEKPKTDSIPTSDTSTMVPNDAENEHRDDSVLPDDNITEQEENRRSPYPPKPPKTQEELEKIAKRKQEKQDKQEKRQKAINDFFKKHDGLNEIRTGIKGKYGKEKELWGRTIKGVNATTKKYTEAKLQRLADDIHDAKHLDKVGRVVTGTATAAGAAMIGVSLGLAAEDPNKIAQYGAGLGAAGYALGSTRSKSNYDMKALEKVYEKGKYGSGKEADLEYAMDNFLTDRDLLKGIQNAGFDKIDSIDDAQKMAEKYKDLYAAGVRDVDSYIAAIKMCKEKNWTKPKAAAVAKLSTKAGSKPSGMSEKALKEFKSQLKRIAENNNVKDTDKFVDTAIDNINQFAKAKDSLNEVKLENKDN